MLVNSIKLSKESKRNLAKNKLLQSIIHSNTTACNNINHKDFDLEKAKKQSENNLVALECNGGLQAMLAAQMLSIHKLQQSSLTLAQGLSLEGVGRYYINTAIKLSNTFIQQANLLAKLQGMGGQKIVVERVDVHQGGQAVVGNIQGSLGNKEKL